MTGITLLILGTIGVLSMLASDFNLDFLPEETVEQIPANLLPYLLLINPMLLLVMLTTAGTLTYWQAGFRVPIVERMFGVDGADIQLASILRSGVVGGIIAGAVIMLLEQAFNPLLPDDYLALSVTMTMDPITRFLYGGITEEILMRFGAMSFIVFLLTRIFGKNDARNVWIAIGITAVLFGMGHLPMLKMAIGDPPAILTTFIILANGLAGIVFGWLYWKRGLECAMVAHIMAHVVMLTISNFVG